MIISIITTLLVHLMVSKCDGLPEDPSVTYDMLYSAGIESYNSERWYECYASIQRALADYKFYHDTLIDCRLECQQKNPVQDQPLSNIELEFFHASLKRSDCLRRCKESMLPDRPEGVSDEIDEEFEELKPYDYLQICAFKAERYDVAAAAAYTYLLANPSHEIMKTNVQFYQSIPEVKQDFFRNMEIKKHQHLYSVAVTAYGAEDWALAVQSMEAAVTEYFQEHRRCLAGCEGRYDHQELPDFYNAIAGKQLTDHWMHVLKCQQNCPIHLATWSNTHISNYLQEHFNYLQYAYYKVGDLKSAASCVESFLLFVPDDEVMLKNKMYYLKQTEDVTLNDFVPKQEVKQYMEDIAKLNEMYRFVRTEYKRSAADEDHADVITPMDTQKKGDDATIAADAGQETVKREEKNEKSKVEKKEDVEEETKEEAKEEVETKEVKEEEGNQDEKKEVSTDDITEEDIYKETEHPFPESLFAPRDHHFQKELSGYLSEQGVRVTAADRELRGQRRVVMDGILSREESEALVQLADIGARQGDGYAGFENRNSPHTDYEKFVGLSIPHTLELLQQGRITEEQANLYLQASEKARKMLEKYYGLTTPLFFHYTHLVCRTALSDANQAGRNDLSHPVHADNCYIQKDGSCLKEPPAYVWRDFSAILYLSEDFEGGDFFFAHRNLSVQQKVRPAVGRMVGFEASHYHGVEAVTKGKRCAVAMWFTLDENYQELAHKAVPQASPTPPQKRELSPSLQQLLSDKGYQLSMTEVELKGPERFAADGLATPEQCNMLIELTKQGGVVGDGYKKPGDEGVGYTSPHTQNERFEGLTVLRAAQLAENKEVSEQAVQMFLDLSQNALEMVQKYFNLDKPLYFDFTHLTCRTAVDGNKLDRSDLSHPVHSDNCIIQADGSCVKKPPAYTQRDYSALLYLNNDFLGGDFFFAHNNMTVQSVLRPTCGRLVGFGASQYHGVQPVLRGQRCALAMWYTLDPRHDEVAHSEARRLLSQLSASTTTQRRPEGPKRDEL